MKKRTSPDWYFNWKHTFAVLFFNHLVSCLKMWEKFKYTIGKTGLLWSGSHGTLWLLAPLQLVSYTSTWVNGRMKTQLFSECLNQSCNYSCSILHFFFTIHFYALILWKKIPSQSPLKCKSHVLHTLTRGSNVLWCGVSDWRRRVPMEVRHLYYMWFWWHCTTSPQCLWVWKRLMEERQWNATHSWAALQHKTNYVCFSVREVCVYSKAKAEADTRKGLDADYEGILMILHYISMFLLHIDMMSLISDNTAKAS